MNQILGIDRVLRQMAPSTRVVIQVRFGSAPGTVLVFVGSGNHPLDRLTRSDDGIASCADSADPRVELVAIHVGERVLE